MKGLFMIFCVVFVHFLYGSAAPQTRTENGYTLTYENLDTTVPQSTFQTYVDMFFAIYPKQCAKYNPNCKKQMALVTDASSTIPAFNAQSKITVSGNYAKTNPNDIEVTIGHETFHSVQAYPNGEPLWITEGLADYAGYEFSPSGARLGKYRPGEHYTQKYTPAAKFFAYLEKRFPGIVKSVDSIMRNGQQSSGQFWVTLTGYTVDQLWDAYVEANTVVCPTGNGITTWNNAARDYALKLMNDKRSQIANGTFKMSNGAIAPAAKNMNKLTYSCEYEIAAQKYLSTCNGSYLLDDAFDSVFGIPLVVNSINDALTAVVPYFFGLTVANQNGNAMLTAGEGHFAYDNALTFGCGVTTTSCDPNVKTQVICLVGPFWSAPSPIYTIGSKCTTNSQCTKPDSPICDIPSGLCTKATNTDTTTSTTTTIAPTTQSYPGCSTGNGNTTWNNAAREYALKLINDKRSQIANGTFTMSNGALAPAAKNMNKLTYSCEYENAAQNFVNTCNGSYILSNTFGFTLGFPWVVGSINEALTIGVPYYFGLTVTNQNGSAMLADGTVHFAYDNAKSVGCGFTTTPCNSGIKTALFCFVGPLKPASSPVYTIGSKCTANSQCTKPDAPTCDIPSGLCVTSATTSTPAPIPITLTFYDELLFKGETKTWTGSGNSCNNFLSDNFNDRVESVNTGNGCVMLYEHRDCIGESVKLDPTCGLAQGCCPYHSSLAQDCKNFVNRASSHKLC